MKSLNASTKRISPLFNINIFVQTNPEYVGLVWGAMNLVFLVSTVPLFEVGCIKPAINKLM